MLTVQLLGFSDFLGVVATVSLLVVLASGFRTETVGSVEKMVRETYRCLPEMVIRGC